MPGLSDSRWAPASNPIRAWPHVPEPTTTRPRIDTQPPSPGSATRPPNVIVRDASAVPERELSRYLKLVARLKWKLPFLAEGYQIAVNRAGRRPEDAAANEIHFKIDFYEYYMHIERALVHLMGVFGIKIHGLADSMHNPIQQQNGGKSDGPRARLGMAVPGQHRYHANVLSALENPQNPLHEALGVGEVRKQLARAKELRNRWKNADEGEDNRGYAPAPLESYNLERILETIFAGFDQGLLIAQAYVQQCTSADKVASPTDWEQEEEDWGFMVDAMDWEAV